MVVVLSGGAGGGRFCRGLVEAVPAPSVTIIGNTADDIDVYGVRVSPDLDLITFSLADVLDTQRGYGLVDDTRVCMRELEALGIEPWFDLGDQDLALCMARTRMLNRGTSLAEITSTISARFGVSANLIPMCNEPVWTAIDSDAGTLHFQDYWVRYRAEVPVRSVGFVGIDRARPTPGIDAAIGNADVILFAPSNPVVSIGPILAVPEMRELLAAAHAPIVAISPIVGGRVVRGMADRLLPSIGVEVRAAGVAAHYADLIDGYVIDSVDADERSEIESLGLRVAVTDTIMRDLSASTALASTALALAESLR